MTLYVGIMSGTSLDGIDVAVINIAENAQVSLICAHTTPFAASLKNTLSAFMQPESRHTLAELGALQQALATAYAASVNTLLQDQQISAQHITAIGCHGQTVWHAPDAPIPYSIQLNNAALLAALTGIDVIDNFRANDLAHGGQGAPLVPPFHQALFMPYPDGVSQRILINIGGIANITVLPTASASADGSAPTIGFDTGPGNTLLDSWSFEHTGKPIDIDGLWARSGECNNTLLEVFLADDYFALPAPKSTGREYFNLHWLKQKIATYHDLSTQISTALPTQSQHSMILRPQDVQATLVALTSVTITEAIAQDGTAKHRAEWLICGGGIHNTLLHQQLQEQCRLHNATLTNMQFLGYDGDAIEAMAFAWFAYCYDNQLPANSPAVTGASQAVILGSKTYA